MEAHIDCSVERLWGLTQDPASHERWDLRFSRIEYLPRVADEPQRFLYERSIVPGVAVRGWGQTTGERSAGTATAASALAFGSDQRRSLIRRGSGYWRYERSEQGMRFITRYDYEPRWGRLGRFVDRLVFRRLIGWATAWSFDRLRLWVEDGVSPERSARAALVHTVAAGASSAAWLYRGARDVRGRKTRALTAVGLFEMGVALAVALRADRRWPWAVNLVMPPLLAGGALRTNRNVTVKSFESAFLTLAMLGLAVAGGLTRPDRPSAKRCHRQPM